MSDRQRIVTNVQRCADDHKARWVNRLAPDGDADRDPTLCEFTLYLQTRVHELMMEAARSPGEQRKLNRVLDIAGWAWWAVQTHDAGFNAADVPGAKGPSHEKHRVDAWIYYMGLAIDEIRQADPERSYHFRRRVISHRVRTIYRLLGICLSLMAEHGTDADEAADVQHVSV